MPAVSKKQQKLMGMIHAVQKGEISPPSKEVAELAKTIKKRDAKEFAKTKHKGLPEKKKKKKANSLEFLAKLANDLDDRSLYSMADQIDLIIQEAADEGGELVSLMPHLEERQLQEESLKLDKDKEEIHKTLNSLATLIDNYLPSDPVYLNKVHKTIRDVGADIYTHVKAYRLDKITKIKAFVSELVSTGELDPSEAQEMFDESNLNQISTADLDETLKELAVAYKLKRELPETQPSDSDL